MGLSQFVLVALCSLTLNIETGLALRCYECTDPLWPNIEHPNDTPKCSDDGYGKEFECVNGSCSKMVLLGKSDYFFHIYTHVFE